MHAYTHVHTHAYTFTQGLGGHPSKMNSIKYGVQVLFTLLKEKDAGRTQLEDLSWQTLKTDLRRTNVCFLH